MALEIEALEIEALEIEALEIEALEIDVRIILCPSVRGRLPSKSVSHALCPEPAFNTMSSFANSAAAAWDLCISPAMTN